MPFTYSSNHTEEKAWLHVSTGRNGVWGEEENEPTVANREKSIWDVYN